MVMEATANDALIPEWQVMETYLQVKSKFSILGISQAINVATATATSESNKSVSRFFSASDLLDSDVAVAVAPLMA